MPMPYIFFYFPDLQRKQIKCSGTVLCKFATEDFFLTKVVCFMAVSLSFVCLAEGLYVNYRIFYGIRGLIFQDMEGIQNIL